METSRRDDLVAKYQYRLRYALAWALSSSVLAALLIFLAGFAFLTKKTIYLPEASSPYTISNTAYSASYYRAFALKALQVRFNFTPDTMDEQFSRLLNLTAPSEREALEKDLLHEKSLINTRNITSVFYPVINKTLVDQKNEKVRVMGTLVRTEQGVLLKPLHKTYQISFKTHLFSPLEITRIDEV